MITSSTILFGCILVWFYSEVRSQSPNEPVPVGPIDIEKVRQIEALVAERYEDWPDSSDFCTTLDIRPPVEDEEEAKNAVTFDRFLWNGTFDLFLDPDWTGTGDDDLARDIFYMEMSYLQVIFGDCMQFRIYPEGATEPKGDYVHVYKGDICASEWVGRKGGKQYVKFSPANCNLVAGILHELMHALGLHHEQNRPDRDDYVKIYWEHIKPEFKSQFNKVDPKFFGTYDVPYDYRSRMHYGEYAFSKDFEPTILAHNGHYIGGTRLGNMTEYDMLKLRRMYKCGD